MTTTPTAVHRIEAERLAALRPSNWPQDAARYVETLAQALADAEERGGVRAVAATLDAAAHRYGLEEQAARDSAARALAHHRSLACAEAARIVAGHA